MLIAVIVIGILIAAVSFNFKPNNLKTQSLMVAGKNLEGQISFATMNLLAKNSKNSSMLHLIDSAGTEFSIESEGAGEKLIKLYKKVLIAKRTSSVDNAYLSSSLMGPNGIYKDKDNKEVKISIFSNYFTFKNDAFFALKLNGNCTTEESLIVDPSMPSKATAKNSCGLIFYDVNGKERPNVLGVDQYIIPLGKHGIK